MYIRQTVLQMWLWHTCVHMGLVRGICLPGRSRWREIPPRFYQRDLEAQERVVDVISALDLGKTIYHQRTRNATATAGRELYRPFISHLAPVYSMGAPISAGEGT